MRCRIHVAYALTAPDGPADVVERVHSIHKDGCPVYRSIHRGIEITTEWRSSIEATLPYKARVVEDESR
jgi:uncharacterized OsmC-like protein